MKFSFISYTISVSTWTFLSSKTLKAYVEVAHSKYYAGIYK